MPDTSHEVAQALESLRAEIGRLREEIRELRNSRPAPQQQLLAFPAPPPSEQLVTLDQLAAMVRLSKRSMERYRGLPAPRFRGRGGRASLWAWGEVRPWLEATFGRSLPENFPTLGAG